MPSKELDPNRVISFGGSTPQERKPSPGEEEFLVEVFCHFCGQLQSIDGFLPGERRPKGRIAMCTWCALANAPDTYKKPADDDLIIAAIRVEEGTASLRQTEINAKFGLEGVNPDRHKLLLSCHEAKKKMEAGDFKGSTAELLSIVKTIARI